MSGLAAKLYIFPVEYEMSTLHISSTLKEQSTREKSHWFTDDVRALFFFFPPDCTRYKERNFLANFKHNSFLAAHEENLEDLTKSDKETPVNP